MLATLVHFAPILAEKSKTPFYVAGGLTVVWALVVSLGLGLRRPSWPGTVQAERLVMLVSLVLVVASTSTAVITSGP